MNWPQLLNLFTVTSSHYTFQYMKCILQLGYVHVVKETSEHCINQAMLHVHGHDIKTNNN